MSLQTQQSSPAVKKTISAPPSKNAQNWFLAGIRLWGLIVLTLHLAAISLPQETAWSVWPYTFFPTWLGWVLALFVAALIIPAVNQMVWRGLSWLWHIWPAKNARQGWFTLAALLAGLFFWGARLRHLRWGDSYMLSVALSYPDLDLRVVYNWQAPFTVFLHQRLWQFVADPWLGWPVENVYATVSIICGMVFVYVLLTFMARLGRNVLESVVLVGLMVTTGSVQLFFGYVENYTIVSLSLLVTMFLGWQALRGDIPPVWPVLGLSMTNAFHPSTVFLWPGMLVLVCLCWKRSYVLLSTALWQTVVPPLFVGGAVLVLMESGGHGLSSLLGVDRPGGGDGIWFVPLFQTTTEWQHYTMFSTAHILDWLNVHFLLSPFALPLIILTLVTVYRFRITLFDQQKDKDYAVFLGVTATCYLLLTWLWNPDYGFQKDWDLFAPAAFVITLLAGYLLVRVLPDREKLKEGSLFVIAVSLLHTSSWIFTNTRPLPRE